ncbi:unnamed protein product, partial [Urochloa humidicola]
ISLVLVPISFPVSSLSLRSRWGLGQAERIPAVICGSDELAWAAACPAVRSGSTPAPGGAACALPGAEVLLVGLASVRSREEMGLSYGRASVRRCEGGARPGRRPLGAIDRSGGKLECMRLRRARAAAACRTE